MDRAAIRRLLDAACSLIHHREYVIIGSLSVLGSVPFPPERMVMSIDVDLYPKNDRDRAGEIAEALGLGSGLEKETGYYADAVSPNLPTLPDGWHERLVPVHFDSGVTAWFLQPNDAAIAEDAEWLAGRTGQHLP